MWIKDDLVVSTAVFLDTFAKKHPRMIGLYITGRFKNVKGMRVDQMYPLQLKCTECGAVHPKYVSGQLRATRQDGQETYEAKVTCKCGVLMSVVSKSPKGQLVRSKDSEHGKVGHFSVPPFAEGFLVSEMDTELCEVVEVPQMEIDVLTAQDILFRDIPIEDGSWAGVHRGVECAQMDLYKVLIKRVEDS